MAKIITDVGLKIIADRIKGLLTEPLKIAWGTGTTAPTAADTGLETEDTTPGYARVTGVSSIVTISVADDTYQVSGAITAQAALVITEWGLYDSAGNLLCREVENPGRSLAIGGTINFVFKIQNIRA